MIKVFRVTCLILMCSYSHAQDKDLAELLMGIGDSVKQLTLTPIEKYNRFKPSERSYLSYSHPIYLSSNQPKSSGRISLFHKFGFYSNLPYKTNRELEANMTFEEISSAENTAILQGQSFPRSELQDSAIKTSSIDYGFIFAPFLKDRLAKNLFFSIGVTSTRILDYSTYSNNSLVHTTGDLIVYEKSRVEHHAELGLSYVLPYFQLGFGYKFGGFNEGLYTSAGVNLPIGIILKSRNKKNGQKNKLQQLQKDAENFKRTTPF